MRSSVLGGMLRRARRVLAESVRAASAPPPPPSFLAELQRAALQAQRVHAALALLGARNPVSLLGPAARLLAQQTRPGVWTGGDAPPLPHAAHLSLWRGYPAALLDQALLERVCPPAAEEHALSPMLAHTKRTYQPSILIRKRRHGFLSRAGAHTGRRVLAARRAKGRRRISA